MASEEFQVSGMDPGPSRDVRSCANVDFISGLHEDILWKIFMINADRTEDAPSRTYEYDAVSNWKDRPVIVAWSCAQVCHRWRKVLLYSPSLWGRLIDLDVFSAIQSLWKEEVIRRIGQSPLFVKGSVFIPRLHERDFFLSILRDHWSRVESFRVRISGGRELDSNTWDLLFRPAPRLRIINLHSRQGFDLSPSHSNMHLFDDHAPLLESFASWKLDVILHPGAEWLSLIRRLDISYSSSMSITDWLQALKEMPCLEYLCLLKALPNPPDTSTSTPIQLPRLGEVNLNGGLRACSVFLAEIVPSADCRLFLDTLDEDESLTSADLSLAIKVLTRYSQNFLHTHNPTLLAFALYDFGFRIADKAPLRDVEKELTFFVDISSPASEHLFSLLQGPSSCNLDNIKALELHTDAASFGGGWAPDVIHFLQRFQNVDSIVTDLSALRTLGDEDLRYSTLFPYLRNVKAMKSMAFENAVADAHALLAFLRSRRNSNTPIEILDFSLWDGFEDVHFFDTIEGLKIIYYDADGLTIREYHCGINNTSIEGRSQAS